MDSRVAWGGLLTVGGKRAGALLMGGEGLRIPFDAGLGQSDMAFQAVKLDLECRQNLIRAAIGAHQGPILIPLLVEYFLLLAA